MFIYLFWVLFYFHAHLHLSSLLLPSCGHSLLLSLEAGLSPLHYNATKICTGPVFWRHGLVLLTIAWDRQLRAKQLFLVACAYRIRTSTSFPYITTFANMQGVRSYSVVWKKFFITSFAESLDNGQRTSAVAISGLIKQV